LVRLGVGIGGLVGGGLGVSIGGLVGGGLGVGIGGLIRGGLGAGAWHYAQAVADAHQVAQEVLDGDVFRL
jgi:hypothetical protein